MVNSWLRPPSRRVPGRDTILCSRDSTSPKPALTQPFGGPCTGQEVVLDRAIHGLLRVGDGKTCRGTLRNRRFGASLNQWLARPTIGTRTAPFVGDKYAR